MSSLKVKAYRFSISWSRLLPNGDAAEPPSEAASVHGRNWGRWQESDHHSILPGLLHRGSFKLEMINMRVIINFGSWLRERPSPVGSLSETKT